MENSVQSKKVASIISMLTDRNLGLKNKLFLIGTIIFFIAILSVAFTFVISKNLTGAAAAINEAGRLRMLTYQIFLAHKGEDLSDFSSAITKFEKNLNLLRVGSQERPLFVQWNKMQRIQFLKIENDFQRIKEKWSKKIYLHHQSIEIKNFLDDIENFVRTIETRSISLARLLQFSQFIMLLGISFISLFIFYFTRSFILSPIMQLHSAFEAVKAGKLDTKVSIETKDEFADLGTNFNDMTSSLSSIHSELKMQNRKLKETWQQLKKTSDRYAALYDYAPVGYFTMDKSGHLLDINKTGISMLRMEHASIIGQSFLMHVIESDASLFLQHLQDILSDPGKIITELRIHDRNNKERFIRLESSTESNASVIRTVMTDISQLKNKTRQIDELLRENRQLTQSMFKVQEEERRYIARELHDELGQWLTAISVELNLITSDVGAYSGIKTCAQGISAFVDKMHAVIHDLQNQLRPPLLDTLGLKESLRELKKEWCSHRPEISFEMVLEGDLENLSERINITIYRVIQESLNNVSKYAEASQVKIRLSREQDETSIDILSLNVEDNGKGYNLNHKTDGMGVLGMRERVIAAGGEFAIRSEPNHGTRIDVRFLHAGSVDICG